MGLPRRGAQAQVLTPHGNSSQPGSPHLGDQLPLASEGRMRPAWRTRADVEEHLERRDVVGLRVAARS